MIMSTHWHVVGARGSDFDAVRSFHAFFSSLVEAIAARRMARAERDVGEILAAYSAEQLAAYGWSAEDIRRLKSGGRREPRI